MNTTTLLKDLEKDILTGIKTIHNEFLTLPEPALNYKSGENSWSILECIEHLNRYARYYIPEVAKGIEENFSANIPSLELNLTWLGKKSIESVSPTAVKPQKTFKRMNPNNSELTLAALEEFLDHQKELLNLIKKAGKADLNKKTVKVEFLKFLKLKTFEALMFVNDHQKRHLQQALKVKKNLKVLF